MTYLTNQNSFQMMKKCLFKFKLLTNNNITNFYKSKNFDVTVYICNSQQLLLFMFIRLCVQSEDADQRDYIILKVNSFQCTNSALN